MLKWKSFSLIKASNSFLFLSFCLILSLTCLKNSNQFIETFNWDHNYFFFSRHIKLFSTQLTMITSKLNFPKSSTMFHKHYSCPQNCLISTLTLTRQQEIRIIIQPTRVVRMSWDHGYFMRQLRRPNDLYLSVSNRREWNNDFIQYMCQTSGNKSIY